MQSKNTVLEISGLSRTFLDGKVKAVDGFNLKVSKGEIISILGPSGCGKTTTMRMIAGLDIPTSGSIRIHGQDVTNTPPYKRNIGMVFQSLAIFPHLTVRENVAFGLRMRNFDKKKLEAKISSALDMVQLSPTNFLHRRPGELSGGQLQRVALARTLVTEPALVLFDEPMAALDRRLRDYMATELRSIQKQLGIAAVYVTHDQETATTMSDRVVVMNAGRIVQDGTPEDIFHRPVERFVSEFLGDINALVIEKVLESDGDLTRVAVEGGSTLWVATNITPLNAGMTVLFRPEQTLVHDIDPGLPNTLRGKLESVQFRGTQNRCELNLEKGSRIISTDTYDPSKLHHSRDVWVSIDPQLCRVVAR